MVTAMPFPAEALPPSDDVVAPLVAAAVLIGGIVPLACGLLPAQPDKVSDAARTPAPIAAPNR